MASGRLWGKKHRKTEEEEDSSDSQCLLGKRQNGDEGAREKNQNLDSREAIVVSGDMCCPEPRASNPSFRGLQGPGVGMLRKEPG